MKKFTSIQILLVAAMSGGILTAIFSEYPQAAAQNELGNVKDAVAREIRMNPQGALDSFINRIFANTDRTITTKILEEVTLDLGIDITSKDDPHADSFIRISRALEEAGITNVGECIAAIKAVPPAWEIPQD